MALDKYNAYSRNVGAVSAYYPIAASDWGVLAPGTTGTAFSSGANLAASASGGSLATSTGAFKIAWVTNYGLSAASVEATVSVTGATGSVTVSLATIGSQNTGAQLNAAPILGWVIYSGNGAGNELLNTQAQLSGATLVTQTFVNGGTTSTISYIPIATTSAVVQVYGTGAAPQTTNSSGILNVFLPTIATSTSTDVDIPVPPAFSTQKVTLVKQPGNVSDTTGMSIDNVLCLAPLWAASTAFSATASSGTFIVINGTLFQCTTAGTTSSLANFPAAFGTSVKGGTVTDNGATWTNRGKGRIIRLRYGNGTGSTVQPLAQELDFVQL